MSLQSQPIEWKRNWDIILPYKTSLDKRELFLQINNFPDEPMYSIIEQGQVIENVEDWPDCWTR